MNRAFFSLLAVAPLALPLLTACGSPPPAAVPPSPPAPPSVAPPAATSPVASSAPGSPAPSGTPGMYLPPEKAHGSPLCLDPDSPALRSVIAAEDWKVDHPVPSAALADDVRDLQGAMKKLYAGYPELLEDPRFDVERFFADWESRLRSGPPTVTFEQGILEPLAVLRHQHTDSHLQVWGGNQWLEKRPELVISEYQALSPLTAKDLAACTFGDVLPIGGTLRATQVFDGSTLAPLATFSAQSARSEVVAHCHGHDVRFERRLSQASHPKRDLPVYEWKTVGDAAVITIRKLWGSPEQEALLEQIARDYPKHRTKPVIVFDFRGNGGGNDGYVYNWVDQAVKGPWRGPYVEVNLAGAALLCADWNMMVVNQVAFGRIDKPDAQKERETYWKKVEDDLPKTTPQQADLGDVIAKGTSPYHGRVLVLVDHDSGSSGESAPDFLHSAMGATIVGERTGGYMEYGNVRPYVLPRTGIVWSMASKRNYYPEPRDAVGI
ncbi:MAG TPA: S41 family peptidase, partial [Polyangiaceae bacterium]